ncbi:hypothetical protein [Micromonospora sp. NPDC023737]|uniref:hypothetical protein n=1 Tax=unclassified Micromonospora TaxID=2617518 RepID=UPI00340B2A5A
MGAAYRKRAGKVSPQIARTQLRTLSRADVGAELIAHVFGFPRTAFQAACDSGWLYANRAAEELAPSDMAVL